MDFRIIKGTSEWRKKGYVWSADERRFVYELDDILHEHRNGEPFAGRLTFEQRTSLLRQDPPPLLVLRRSMGVETGSQEQGACRTWP